MCACAKVLMQKQKQNCVNNIVTDSGSKTKYQRKGYRERDFEQRLNQELVHAKPQIHRGWCEGFIHQLTEPEQKVNVSNKNKSAQAAGTEKE